MTTRPALRFYLLTCLVLSSLVFSDTAFADRRDTEMRRVEEALQAFSHEPDIAVVQEKVLEFRQLQGPSMDRWTRRSRLAGAIPTIQGQASWLDQRDQRNRYRENIRADDEGLYERDSAQHLLYDDLRLRAIYSIRLNFDLSQLLFSSSELAIQREIRNRWAMVDSLVEEVTRLYFARRKQQIYLLAFPDQDLEERIERQLQVEAATAQIDALTGGWFRRQLSEAHR